jgi:hypothetical protein
MEKYYITATPGGLDGDVRQMTTIYPSVKKALEFLKTKTEYQCSKFYIRRVDTEGRDAGLELAPEQTREKLVEV